MTIDRVNQELSMPWTRSPSPSPCWKGVLVVALVMASGRGAVAAGLDAMDFEHEATEAMSVLSSTSPYEVESPSSSSGVMAGRTTCQATGTTLVDTCIDSGMSIFSQATTWIPPDPIGAAGPTTLLAVTNTQIECLRKDDGRTVFGPAPLPTMLSSLRPDILFDPKIIYDVHRSRFVLVVLDKSISVGSVVASRILVAVSKSASPTSTNSSDWYFDEIDAWVDGWLWADYPGLAVDEEAIYITCNMFDDNLSFGKSLLWIVAKTPLYSGGVAATNVYDYKLEANGGFYGTHMPAMVRSAAGIAPNVGTYLVMYDGITNNGTERLSVIQIDSPLQDPVFRHAWVDIGDVEDYPTYALNNAPQRDPLGRGALIAVNSRKVLDAVWVQNQLWIVTTVRSAPSGETSAFWVKLNATGVDFPPTLADRGYIDGEDIGPGTYTFFPSVDVNAMGVAAFGFSASSRSIYPSAYAAIRDDRLDSAGTVRAAMLIKRGEAPYYITFGGPRNRWGDYSGMVLDPSNESCFWAFNEYAGMSTYTSQVGQYGSWKTAWARLCYSRTATPCKGLNKVCTSKTQCCQPSNKVCDGPAGTSKRCKVCLRRGATCARSQQCCRGLTCRGLKCKP